MVVGEPLDPPGLLQQPQCPMAVDMDLGLSPILSVLRNMIFF